MNSINRDIRLKKILRKLSEEFNGENKKPRVFFFRNWWVVGKKWREIEMYFWWISPPSQFFNCEDMDFPSMVDYSTVQHFIKSHAFEKNKPNQRNKESPFLFWGFWTLVVLNYIEKRQKPFEWISSKSEYSIGKFCWTPKKIYSRDWKINSW